MCHQGADSLRSPVLYASSDVLVITISGFSPNNAVFQFRYKSRKTEWKSG